VALDRDGLKDTTVHGYAQVVKILRRFAAREGYAPENAMARGRMPKVDQRILPALSSEDVKALNRGAESARDRARRRSSATFGSVPTCSIIPHGQTVLFVGLPSVGMPHLVISPGMAAIQQATSVYLVAIVNLPDQLHRDAKEDHLDHRLHTLCRPRCSSWTRWATSRWTACCISPRR